MLPYCGQYIGERSLRFVVPGGPLDGDLPLGVQRMGQQRYYRVQAEQTRGGALDGTIRPLPRRFNAEMCSALLKGRLDCPSLDEALHKFARPIAGAGRAVRPGIKLARWDRVPAPPAPAAPDGRSDTIRPFRWSRPDSRRRPESQGTRTRCQCSLLLLEHLPQLRQAARPSRVDGRWCRADVAERVCTVPHPSGAVPASVHPDGHRRLPAHGHYTSGRQ